VIVADLARSLDERFPFASALEWDPVGIQLGGPQRPIGRVAVCHEVTEDIVAGVERDGIDTLVSYHPLLFAPTRYLLDGPTAEGRALRLAAAQTTVIVVHTAMDVAVPGTGDAALRRWGLATSGTFGVEGDSGAIGRFADFDSNRTVARVRAELEQHIGAAVRVADAGRPIRRLGVLPGSGSSLLDQAAGTVDAVVTGDVSHHRASAARSAGVTVFDAGHSATERAGVEELYAAVRAAVPTAMPWNDDPTPWER
jgi:dinuclear metal center YbgI/SA1388 family protein